jgi:hypothetical protein
MAYPMVLIYNAVFKRSISIRETLCRRFPGVHHAQGALLQGV